MLCLSGFELSSRGCPCYVPHLKHVWKIMRPCRAISSFFFNKSLSDLAIVIFFWLSFQRCRQIITNSSLWQKLKKTNKQKKKGGRIYSPVQCIWKNWTAVGIIMRKLRDWVTSLYETTMAMITSRSTIFYKKSMKVYTKKGYNVGVESAGKKRYL